MKTFYYSVFDYFYEKRLSLFQSMFYTLYDKYGKNGNTEAFISEWFDSYTLSKLLRYFPLSDLIHYYSIYIKHKRKVIRSYIWTYWAFCQAPQKYTQKIKESMKFFNLEDIDEFQIKRRYRQLVKRYHPDVCKDRELAHKQMLLINYHYQVLTSYVESLKKRTGRLGNVLEKEQQK